MRFATHNVSPCLSLHSRRRQCWQSLHAVCQHRHEALLLAAPYCPASLRVLIPLPLEEAVLENAAKEYLQMQTLGNRN
eukprot:1137517-Pelagomonas_calceolata.AAC.2